MFWSLGMLDWLCLYGSGMDKTEEEVECAGVWVCLTV